VTGAVSSVVAATGVATLTLCQPQTRNALTPDLLNDLGDALTAALGDDNVRLIVMTNEGNTFCAGADLKGGSPTPARYGLVQILQTILDAPKPIVGRIAGHCMGGGVGLAAACDISVAAEDVLFGFTEARIGVAPAVISVVCLPKMRRADASELFLSGERISAARAVEVGLINRCVPAEELDAAVSDVAAKVAAGGPEALAACKQLIIRVPDMERGDAFTWTEALSARLFASDEATAGIAAFRSRMAAPWVARETPAS